MLLSALQESQSLVCAYDAKAQIVGVGYVLALNLVVHFGDTLPKPVPHSPLFLAVVWAVVILPILQFGCAIRPGALSEPELSAVVLSAAACPRSIRRYWLAHRK